MYGIDELSGSITRYDFDIGTGNLIRRETVTTLPESFTGENWCADLAITPDGRFLFTHFLVSLSSDNSLLYRSAHQCLLYWMYLVILLLSSSW